MLYKAQSLNSIFWLSLVSPMDMRTRWLWLIPLRDTRQIPLLLMGIYGIRLNMELPMTMPITMTTPLIALALVAMTLTLGYNTLRHLRYSSIT